MKRSRSAAGGGAGTELYFHRMLYFPGRIKRANRIGEDRLYEAEALDAMARHLAPDYRPGSDFRSAWEKILFNQFHDILPGSGVLETGEYALGEFQRAMAASQINLNHAMRSICAPDGYQCPGRSGGSRPFLRRRRRFRHGGRLRLYDRLRGAYFRPLADCDRFQSPSPYQAGRDPHGSLGLAGRCPSADRERSGGKSRDCQVVEEGTHYWGHHYHTVLLYGEVKGLGYASFVLEEKEEERLHKEWASYSNSPAEDPRLDHFTDLPLVMENELVKAVFDRNT